MTKDTIQEQARLDWLNMMPARKWAAAYGAALMDRIDALEAENARLTASVSELERQAEEVEQGHYRMAVAANEMIHKVWEHLGGQDPTREGGSNLVGRTAELRARADAAEAEVARLREELASRLSPSPPDGGQATDWRRR